MPRLVLHPGREDQRSIPIEGSITIGRGQDCDLMLPDTALSRKHARIDVVAGQVVVSDLKSSNGTFVNDVKIERRELRLGDIIRCGSQSMEFAADEAPSETRGVFIHTRAISPRLTMADLLPRGVPASASSLRIPSKDGPKRAQEKLEILLQVSELLSSPEPIDGLLSKILELVFRILDVERGAILMVGADGELVPKSVKSTIPSEDGAQIWSRHIVGRVLSSGVAAIYRDAASDVIVTDMKSIVEQSIRSSMCAPLRPKDDVVGVLYVDNVTRPNIFSEEDLEFLGAFANQAAIAIENASLYKRIEEEAVMRNNLLRFFPPATIAKVIESKATLGVIETEVTALFADISEFTRISSAMEPRQIVELLNEYFPVVARVVFEHEGTLEKYIGDALLAVWGAPFGHPDDADRALRAAIGIQRAAVALSRGVARKYGIELRVHIGLNTGKVAAGNIGSDAYIQYATIGDATNVASRICSAAPDGEIWIAESTRRVLRDPAFVTEALPPIRVKGKDDALVVHRVQWTPGAPAGDTLESAS